MFGSLTGMTSSWCRVWGLPKAAYQAIDGRLQISDLKRGWSRQQDIAVMDP